MFKIYKKKVKLENKRSLHMIDVTVTNYLQKLVSLQKLIDTSISATNKNGLDKRTQYLFFLQKELMKIDYHSNIPLSLQSKFDREHFGMTFFDFLLQIKIKWLIAGLKAINSDLKKISRKIGKGITQNHKVLHKRIKGCPSFIWLTASNFLFSSKFQKEIFEPIAADWQEEYYEALFKKEIWKARWINLRYTYAFLAAMWQKSPIGDLMEFVIKIAKP